MFSIGIWILGTRKAFANCICNIRSKSYTMSIVSQKACITDRINTHYLFNTKHEKWCLTHNKSKIHAGIFDEFSCVGFCFFLWYAIAGCRTSSGNSPCVLLFFLYNNTIIILTRFMFTRWTSSFWNRQSAEILIQFVTLAAAQFMSYATMLWVIGAFKLKSA